MHNAAFEALGLDWSYEAREVEPDDLERTIEELQTRGFAGANVTAPYKRDVARIVGSPLESVNTLVFAPTMAASTDAAVLDRLEFGQAVIVGDGGAAVAFRAALPQARVFARRGDWPPDTTGAALVVNATSATAEVVVRVGSGQTLVDLPYPQSATAEAALSAGARVVGGLEVLVAQGAASFELWTGVAAPVESMRRAVGLTGASALDSG